MSALAKIAYVDHSFHSKTLSTDFLPAILRRHGHEVDYFWDDAWSGGSPVLWDDVQSYDVVIMFQAFCPIGNQYYRELHPNVVFIPMLDQFGIWQGPQFNLTAYWEPFQGSKVLNFSNAMHGMVSGFGIASKVVRFYQPESENFPEVKVGLHGFFWLRREDQIPWATIRELISETRFDSFHVHVAPDPGSPKPTLPSSEDIEKYNITLSNWFEHKSDFNLVLENANIFFAPRMEEGIGQSFLEAMARGQCVVAPNHGTMNEYIFSGVNGLLYDAKTPHPIDFSGAIVAGKNAKENVKIGYASWVSSEVDIVEFILKPSVDLYNGKYQHAFPPVNSDARMINQLQIISQHHRYLRTPRFFGLPFMKILTRVFKNKA